MIIGYKTILVFYLECKKVYIFGLFRSPFYDAKPNLGSAILSHVYSLVHPSAGALLSTFYLMVLIASDSTINDRKVLLFS